MVWPDKLAVLYPMRRDGWPSGLVLAASLGLVSLTAGAWLLRRKQPAVLMGWLWYLGMLVPVIGLFQVGSQAYADRYTDLTQIGLYLAVTWLVADWAGSKGRRRVFVGGLALAGLCFLFVAAHRQTEYWRDSSTLWTQTLRHTKDNFIAHNNLGNTLREQGNLGDASAQYHAALRVNPVYAEAHNNLGIALNLQGRQREAVARFREAIRLNPLFAEPHFNLGVTVFGQGDPDEAAALFRAGLKLKPGDARAHAWLGGLLLLQGKDQEASISFQQALVLQPNDVHSQNNLAWLLATSKQATVRNGPKALELAKRVNQSPAGSNAGSLDTLAAAYAEAGDFSNAVQAARKALQLSEAQADQTLVESIRRNLMLYESNRTYSSGR